MCEVKGRECGGNCDCAFPGCDGTHDENTIEFELDFDLDEDDKDDEGE